MSYILKDPFEHTGLRHMSIALFASLLFHCWLLSEMLMVNVDQQSPALVVQIIDLPQLDEHSAKIEPDVEPIKKQIVSETGGKPEEPPKDINLLADKNSKVEVEKIRRGNPDAGISVPPQPPEKAGRVITPSASPKAIRAETVKAKKDLGKRADSGSPKDEAVSRQPLQVHLKSSEFSLHLSDDLIERKFLAPPQRQAKQGGGEEKEGQAAKLSDGERQSRLREYVPFNTRRAALIPGKNGSDDYLPGVQDGEITLLNAKADRHAVFVRRVALQVFGILKKLSWAELPRNAITQLRELTTVNAVMSKDGRLLEVKLSRSSGVSGFDRLVVEAARKGAWDQNPPLTATLPDGNIHFIFTARTWSKFVGDNRSEQRWLLLSTGLE